jgi:TP901 family phage tail tape measure protein
MAERDLLLRMRFEGAQSVAQDLTLLAGKMGLAGVALSAIEAIKQTSEFQATMERLQTQTNATSGEVRRATKGILGMAVGVATSPNSLAQAMYHLESAGFRGKTALTALKVAAQGAKIGNADLIDTTTAMAATMVAGYGKGRSASAQLRSAMGELNATVGAGDMTFQDLNNSLQSGILATFKTAGLTIKDFGAAMAVLGDNNIRGAQASTELRMTIAALIGPSDRSAKAMAQIGLKPLQLADDLRKPNGFLAALTDLKTALQQLPDPAQRANTVMEIVGRRQAGPILTMINDLQRLRNKYDLVGKGAQNFNRDWEETKKTWSFVLGQLKVLIDMLLLKLGYAIQYVVQQMVGFIRAFKQGHFWAVALMAVIAGGVGTLALWAGKVFIIGAATRAWAAATWLLNAAMDANPLFLLISLTLGLAIAISTLLNHSRSFRRFWTIVWWDIEKVFVHVVNAIIDGLNFLIDCINSIHLPKIKIFGVTLFGGWGGLGIGHIGHLGMPGNPLAPPGRAPATAAQVMSATSPITSGGLQHPPPASIRRHPSGVTIPGGGGGLTVPGSGSVTVPQPSMHNLDSLTPRVAKAVRDGLHGAAVYMDGQQVGKLLVRQGNLQRATR